MAMFHGKNGKVVWNAEDGASDIDILHVTSWKVDATCDVTESTGMGDDWKNYLAGFKTWSATVEGFADGAPQVGYATSSENDGLGGDLDASTSAEPKLELWFTATEGDGILYGSAKATGVSHTVDANDVGKVTYTFQGCGALAWTDTEPTYA